VLQLWALFVSRFEQNQFVFAINMQKTTENLTVSMLISSKTHAIFVDSVSANL
jgi:hypothetical protein